MSGAGSTFANAFATVYGAITSARHGRQSLELGRESMEIERERMTLMGREVTMRENEQTAKEARAAKSAEFMQGLLDRWKVEEFDASRAMDTFLGELAVQSGFDLPAGTANKVKTSFRETYDRLIGMGIGEDQSMLHAMQETQKRYVQFGLDAVKKARGLPDFMPEPSPDDFRGGSDSKMAADSLSALMEGLPMPVRSGIMGTFEERLKGGLSDARSALSKLPSVTGDVRARMEADVARRATEAATREAEDYRYARSKLATILGHDSDSLSKMFGLPAAMSGDEWLSALGEDRAQDALFQLYSSRGGRMDSTRLHVLSKFRSPGGRLTLQPPSPEQLGMDWWNWPRDERGRPVRPTTSPSTGSWEDWMIHNLVGR